MNVLDAILARHPTNLVIAVDTSGSMSASSIQCVLDVVAEVSKTINTTVMACDWRVHIVVDGRRFDKHCFMGGSGTNFNCAFDEVEIRKLNPDLMVYFTDGWGTFPKQPSYKVMWALVGRGPFNDIPWGEVVYE